MFRAAALFAALACFVGVAVHAAPVACSGDCARTLFNAATAQVCDYIDVDVTANGAAGPVIGTSVYTTTTDIGGAAAHAGILGHGVTGTVRLYWMGQQALLYGSTLAVAGYSSVASARQLTPAAGVLVTSPTATCDAAEISINVTVLHAAVLAKLANPAALTAAYGAGYFSSDSDLSRAFIVDGWSPVITPSDQPSLAPLVPMLLYVHYIGTRSVFLPTGPTSAYLSTARSAPSHAYAFATHGASQPHAASLSVNDFPVRLNHTNTNLPTNAVYGAAPYYSRASCVVRAAVQQGDLSPYEGRRMWVHLAPEATRFYAAASNGIASLYADDAAGGFQITMSDTPPPKYPNGAAVAFVRFFITTTFSTATTLRGTNVYAYDSDLAKVAFHSGLSNVLRMVNAYVFDIGTTPYLFASTYYGVASSAITNTRAIYMSYDPRPSLVTNDTLTRFRVIPTPVSGTMYGTTYYAQSSDLTSATLHAGLGTLGVPVEVYVTLIGARSIFLASARYGFLSVATAASMSAFCLSLTPSDGLAPPEAADPLVTQVTLTLTQRSTALYGTDYYRFDSELTIAAHHMQYLPFEETRVLFVHLLGARRNFLSTTRGAVTSTAVAWNGWSVPALAFAIRDTAVYDPAWAPDVMDGHRVRACVQHDCHPRAAAAGVQRRDDDGLCERERYYDRLVLPAVAVRDAPNRGNVVTRLGHYRGDGDDGRRVAQPRQRLRDAVLP
jgi:hypothetical protein